MPSLDTIVSYHRLKKNPLDDTEVFYNIRDLMDYCDTGACYDGQRVVVVNDRYGCVEYVIKHKIPVIDMKGSEPIFGEMVFDGDTDPSTGMLIYECNSSMPIWNAGQVFSFKEGFYNLLSQIEIFRLKDPINTNKKIFKFYLTRTARYSDTPNSYVSTWSQDYNPFLDGKDHVLSYMVDSFNPITEMSFSYDSATYENYNVFLATRVRNIKLMTNDFFSARDEEDYITKIYVKAENYKNAYNFSY